MVQKPHLDTKTESHQNGGKSTGGASASSTCPKKRGTLEDSVPDVLQLTSSSPLSLSVVQVGTLSNFFRSM